MSASDKLKKMSTFNLHLSLAAPASYISQLATDSITESDQATQQQQQPQIKLTSSTELPPPPPLPHTQPPNTSSHHQYHHQHHHQIHHSTPPIIAKLQQVLFIIFNLKITTFMFFIY